MGSALWAGISGLNASSMQMDVIGNNIANVNTIGYKAGKIFFADVLSQSVSGGSSGSMQVGRGVSVTEVATQFGSGSFETTSNATDVAIDGDGFFMVTDVNGGTYYTRSGAFHLDNDGYLVDTNGYKVQGYNLTGSSTNTITDISLRNVQSSPQVTSIFSLGVNLNADTDTGDAFNSSQTVYDSLGATHTLNMAFTKTEANGYWGFQCSLDAANATAQTYSGLKFDSDGVLDKVYTSSIGTPTITTAGDGEATATVNNVGQLYKDSTAITLTRGASAAAWTITDDGGYDNMVVSVDGSDVEIDLDGAGGADITYALTGTWAENDTIAFTVTQTEVDPIDLSITFATIGNGATIGSSNAVTWDLAGSTALDLTGYASTSVIKSLSNDGYASGILKSLSVSGDGKINGFFTNGQTCDIAQLVLADFDNPLGMKKMGSNLFGETVTSGAAIKNVPGASGMGEVKSNCLEMSNTDVATEFINMITAQKAYQASARVITTQDQMMSELMNIKRS